MSEESTRKQKRINFDKESDYLHTYLEGKGNASDYMRKLLQKDYEEGQGIGESSKQAEIIERLERIERILNNVQLMSQQPLELDSSEESGTYSPTEEDVSNLTDWGIEL